MQFTVIPSHATNGWSHWEEHRSNAGHAEPDQGTRDLTSNARALQRNDEGEELAVFMRQQGSNGVRQAGMIEEILEETFEDLEDDDVEELADKEVEKVLWEVTTGQLGQLSGTPSATPQDDGVSPT